MFPAMNISTKINEVLNPSLKCYKATDVVVVAQHGGGRVLWDSAAPCEHDDACVFVLI